MRDNSIAILLLGAYFVPILYNFGKLLRDYFRGKKGTGKKIKRFALISGVVLVVLISLFLTLGKVNFLNYEAPVAYKNIELYFLNTVI